MCILDFFSWDHDVFSSAIKQIFSIDCWVRRNTSMLNEMSSKTSCFAVANRVPKTSFRHQSMQMLVPTGCLMHRFKPNEERHEVQEWTADLWRGIILETTLICSCQILLDLVPKKGFQLWHEPADTVMTISNYFWAAKLSMFSCLTRA